MTQITGSPFVRLRVTKRRKNVIKQKPLPRLTVARRVVELIDRDLNRRPYGELEQLVARVSLAEVTLDRAERPTLTLVPPPRA